MVIRSIPKNVNRLLSFYCFPVNVFERLSKSVQRNGNRSKTIWIVRTPHFPNSDIKHIEIAAMKSVTICLTVIN